LAPIEATRPCGRLIVTAVLIYMRVTMFLPYDFARLSGEPGLFLLTPVAAHGERAHIYAMANLRVTCIFGAIYEVIKTTGPSRETRPFKCVLCDRELFAWEGNNVGQFRLVWRPDEDRE
jgi:hypothetical protein